MVVMWPSGCRAADWEDRDTSQIIVAAYQKKNRGHEMDLKDRQGPLRCGSCYPEQRSALAAVLALGREDDFRDEFCCKRRNNCIYG